MGGLFSAPKPKIVAAPQPAARRRRPAAAAAARTAAAEAAGAEAKRREPRPRGPRPRRHDRHLGARRAGAAARPVPQVAARGVRRMDPAAILARHAARAGAAPPARAGLAGLLRPRPAAARRRPGAVRRHRGRRRRTARRLAAGRADAALVALVRPGARARRCRRRSRPRRRRGAGGRGGRRCRAHLDRSNFAHRDAPGLPRPGGRRHRPAAGRGSAARRGLAPSASPPCRCATRCWRRARPAGSTRCSAPRA